jgi:hypothetical protein
MHYRFGVLSAGLLAMMVFTAAADDVADIGSRRELFVDDYLIDRLSGTALRLHEPVEREAALRFDKPWEGPFCGYVTVLKDGGRYRAYYRGLPEAKKDGSNFEVTCYAESRDGIRFTKPDLGIYEVHGTTKNNVILADAAPCSHNFSPFIDTKPGVPAAARYKAVAGTSKSGLIGFVSADGIHWKKLREKPLITEGAFDSQNLVFWSEREECYCCYLRTWSEGGWGGYRWVSRCTSKDFLNWTAPVGMKKGDAPWEHIYTNQTLPYYRAPHIYLSVCARFMPGRRVISEEEADAIGIVSDYDGDCSDNVLMSSRGGTRYDRTFMEALIKPGIGFANWTSRTNYPAWGIVPINGKEMSIYVQHNYAQPSACLVRYSLRPDGFVSVNAPYAGGEMLTRPLRFSGSELRLNYATSAAGVIRVEIQDAAGKALAGFRAEDCAEIIGNMTDRPVRWKGGGDVSALAGEAVRLRFVMKDADLYAIRFE